MTAPWMARAALVAWLSGLSAGLVWLWGLDLPLGPLWGEATVAVWTSPVDAEGMTIALLRLCALLSGGYLLAVSVLALAGRLLHVPASIARAVEGLLPGLVRRTLRGALGAGLAAAVVTTSPAGSALRDGPSTASTAPEPAGKTGESGPVVMRRLDAGPVDVGSLDTGSLNVEGDGGDAIVMRRLDEPPASTGPAPGTRSVRPGEHFWSIAADELERTRGRPPTDAEIDPYWRQLVAVNAQEAPEPDLLLPGQMLVIPPVP